MTTRPATDTDDVRSIFEGIAPRYDLLNRLLSAGIDRRWRRRAVDRLGDLRGRSVLDVATGTADLALEAAHRGPARIVGIDIAGPMLERARAKVEARALGSLISLARGAAEAIPFPDASFDAAMVAFGARNFADLDRGLAEMRRVLRPGGRLVVLEFSRPRGFPVRQFYLFYFTRVLPLIGRLVSGHRRAYRYLPDSVLAFPEGRAFTRRLEQAGFERTVAEPLSTGIATIYSADRPRAG